MMMMPTPFFSPAPHLISLNSSSAASSMDLSSSSLSSELNTHMILGVGGSSSEFLQQQLDSDQNNRSICTGVDGNPLSFLECSKDNAELAGTLLKAVALGLIILFTIFGNVLVLMSVAVSRNLRSSTHYLIVNLAVADLLLGTTVLPFSAVFEVTGRWYFGQTFCTIWAAVDVLCCTSSILSLCVISLDRYIGVTRPLAYSSIMVGRRTSFLILLIWTSSIAISIGPLLGWKEPPSSDPYFCTVNKQLGYVLFSVTGSFYLPMFVIIGVYWKIYKAAIRQTKFLECGQKTTKQDITLRVHLGGKFGNRMNFNPDIGGKFGGGTPKHQNKHKLHQQTQQRSCPGRDSASGSCGQSDGDLSIAAAELNSMNGVGVNGPNLLNLAPLARPEKSSISSIGGGNIEMECHNHHNYPHMVTCGSGGGDPGVILRVHRGGKAELGTWTGVNNSNNPVTGMTSNNGRHCPAASCQSKGGMGNGNGQRKHTSGGGRLCGKNSQHLKNETKKNETTALNNHHHHNTHHHHPHGGQGHHPHQNNGSQANSLTPSPPSSSPERKLNPGFGKIAKFRRQKKAAKTLAIVVGIFLLCWFPFFFVLPLGALCTQCNIPEWMFNLFFWLGYFNSCLNPLIYGCTSKEFQRAFRRILCRRLPPRPHISRAIYRANMCNNNRFGGERPSGGGGGGGQHGNNGNAIPLHQWS